MTYQVDVKNTKNTILTERETDIADTEGFVLWYLSDVPQIIDASTHFGYRPDYNGLGVFVFKHKRKWRILGINNYGLMPRSIDEVIE